MDYFCRKNKYFVTRNVDAILSGSRKFRLNAVEYINSFTLLNQIFLIFHIRKKFYVDVFTDYGCKILQSNTIVLVKP